MRLKELRLNDFGKFHNKTINLKDGINIIYGENEAGKSTVHSFIKGMLFGIEKPRGRTSKENAYEKYKPWDRPGSYCGSMDVDKGGKFYRIIRNFDKNNKSLTVIDLETGRESDQAEALTALLGELTESGYRNTISVEQLKAKTDQELAEEVRNYITNLSLAKSNEVDVTKALAFLKSQKKELEDNRLQEKITALELEIEEGSRQELKADQLSLKLNETKVQEKSLEGKKEIFSERAFNCGFDSLDDYQEHLERFPVIKEKYRNYKEAKQQKDRLSQKQEVRNKSILEYREELPALLKQKIKEYEVLKTAAEKKNEEYNNDQKEQESSLNQEKKGQSVYSLLLFLSGLAAVLYFSGKNSLLTGTAIILLLSGILFYFWSFGRIRKRRNQILRNCSGLKEELAGLNKQMTAILVLFDAADEKALKLKQEEAIKQEMNLEHLIRQGKEEEEQLQGLNSRLTLLKREITEYLRHLDLKGSGKRLEVIITEDGWMEEAEEWILREKELIVRQMEEFTRESEELRIQKEKLKWELLSIEGYEDKLLENQHLYQELLQQKKENDLELNAINLSVETINGLSADIHDSFGRKINELISGLGMKFTSRKYSDIKIDEKLNIKAGSGDKYVTINKLSAGTMEQLYLALRLSIADLVYGPDIMPILLDDCFALYDDKRTGDALKYLAEQRNSQILLFTCHNREKAILESFNIDFFYIDLSKEDNER